MKLFYNKWEKWSTIIIIFILLFIGLSGCSHQMIPFETKIIAQPVWLKKFRKNPKGLTT